MPQSYQLSRLMRYSADLPDPKKGSSTSRRIRWKINAILTIKISYPMEYVAANTDCNTWWAPSSG